MDELHWVIRVAYGGNVIVPISTRPTKILDVGTGTGSKNSHRNKYLIFVGRWPIEVAEKYASARVIGLDLSPIQPTFVPLNCEFIVADLRDALEDFDEGSVDLVHSRYVEFTEDCNDLRFIHAGITKDEWPKFVARMFRVLKPGNGWAQCTESGMPKYDCDITTKDTVLPKVCLFT